jgi:signal transduction histidine kinase
MQLSLIQRQIRRNPEDADQLVTSASDQLAQSLAELRGLSDRVEALRGRLTVVSPVGGGTVVRAELPARAVL